MSTACPAAGGPLPGTPLTVTWFPGRFRPGVGRPPRREGRRPLMPQHARLCAPLEAANALGYLVYPALEDHESFQVRRTAPGELQFSFFGGDRSRPLHLFTLRYALPAGGVGIWSEEVSFLSRETPLGEAEIRRIRDAVLRLGSLWVPPGAVALRGAQDFRTPPGWDTVVTGVLNQAQPPPLCALTARVQTDWYAFETEFRYVLQVGDVLGGSGRIPVGQAFVVPRVDTELRQGDRDEVEAFRVTQQEFAMRKIGAQTTNALGLGFDTVYREATRSATRTEGDAGSGA